MQIAPQKLIKINELRKNIRAEGNVWGENGEPEKFLHEKFNSMAKHKITGYKNS